MFCLGYAQQQQEEMEEMEIQKGLVNKRAPPGLPGGFDAAKVLKTEVDNLKLVLSGRGRRFYVDGAEKNLLGNRGMRIQRRREVNAIYSTVVVVRMYHLVYLPQDKSREINRVSKNRPCRAPFSSNVFLFPSSAGLTSLQLLN